MKNGSMTRIAKIAIQKMFRIGTQQFSTPLGAVINVTTTVTHEETAISLNDVPKTGAIYQIWGLELGLRLLGEPDNVTNSIVDALLLLNTDYLPSNLILCDSRPIDRPDGEQDREDNYRNYRLNREQQEIITTALKNRKIAMGFPDHALMLIDGALS